MKKTLLITAFASAIALFAGPASAGVNVTRIVPVDYQFPAVGHGDLGGVCFNQPTVPPVPPQLGSCMAVTPEPGEDHVSVSIRDSAGERVYITIQQDNNPGFDWGCGDIVDFPINDTGPGGAAADDVVVFAWAGPGINDFFETLDPASLCNPGSTNLGGGGGTFTFYDDVA
jgi:hypothetical protein